MQTTGITFFSIRSLFTSSFYFCLFFYHLSAKRPLFTPSQRSFSPFDTNKICFVHFDSSGHAAWYSFTYGDALHSRQINSLPSFLQFFPKYSNVNETFWLLTADYNFVCSMLCFHRTTSSCIGGHKYVTFILFPAKHISHLHCAFQKPAI